METRHIRFVGERYLAPSSCLGRISPVPFLMWNSWAATEYDTHERLDPAARQRTTFSVTRFGHNNLLPLKYLCYWVCLCKGIRFPMHDESPPPSKSWHDDERTQWSGRFEKTKRNGLHFTSFLVAFLVNNFRRDERIAQTRRTSRYNLGCQALRCTYH